MTRRPSDRRTFLESPWLAALLGAVVLLLALAILLPGLLNPTGPGPTATHPPEPSPTAPTPSPSPAAPTFVRPTPSPAPTFTAYVVRQGDTLTSIARAYRTSARSIAWWNRGTYPSLDPESEGYDPNHLEVGWRLVLIPDTVVDDTNPPTPSPGSTSSQGATGLAATVIRHGARTSPAIALTFDMGGRLDPAVDIVQWLIDHGVHATLFPTGVSGTQTTRGLEAMQLAATRPDLFDFGNHSWDHPDFRTLTAAQMGDEITSTEAALLPIVGSTKPWFRPPFGGYDDSVRAGVGAAGWSKLVLWDVDMIDWRPVADGGPTAADMVAKLRASAQGGSIVLMHLGGYNTLAALPGLLAALGEMHLEPSTLTELLGS